MPRGDGAASSNGSGWRRLGHDVPLGPEASVAALGVAQDGAPVFALDLEGAEPPGRLLERAASALAAWRRIRPLLRILPMAERFDVERDPVLCLRAGASPPPAEALALLETLRYAEVRVEEGGGTAGSREGASEKAARADSPAFDPAEEVKRRIVRLSPDVLEEADGDRVRFRVARAVLATLERRDGRVFVRPGGGGEEIEVEERADVDRVMDEVFERFFGLSPTRRRIARAVRRSERPAPEPLEAAPEEARPPTGEVDAGRASL